VNPKGIPASSPRLPRSGYLGIANGIGRNPVRVAVMNCGSQGSRYASLRGNPGLCVETASRFKSQELITA